MHLRLPQRPFLPIRHLLVLANSFAIHFFGNFSQPSLRASSVDSCEICLHVNEVVDVSIKSHLRELSCELFNIRGESESYNHRLFIFEYLLKLKI